MLIKDLKNVKDDEITLLDVKRAEEIIERANKLLGRKTECHHWHGWTYPIVVNSPYIPSPLPIYTPYISSNTSGGTAGPNKATMFTGTSGANTSVNLATSLTDACNQILTG